MNLRSLNHGTKIDNDEWPKKFAKQFLEIRYNSSKWICLMPVSNLNECNGLIILIIIAYGTQKVHLFSSTNPKIDNTSRALDEYVENV